MHSVRPDIFTYTDYRRYLKELHAWLKKENRQFSHRYIASKVRAGSAGWFSDVISGRINLTDTYISRLVSVVKLSTGEAEFFRTLVHCNQTKNIEEQNRFLTMLIEHRSTGTVTVSRERFMYYSTWYLPVIRELLFFYDFTDDFKSLARMLRPPIRATQARQAIRVLLDLDFIAPDENGYLRPKDAIVRKERGFTTIHWANYQKAALDLASGAIERFGKDERDISSVLIGLSPDSFTIARTEIARLRKKLLELSEADRKRNGVYQCTIQIFPTTKPIALTHQGGYDD